MSSASDPAYRTHTAGALITPAQSFTIPARLPAVVSKRLVGLSHAVHIFLLLHGRAAPVGRIQQLVAQLVGHALFATIAAIRNQPANRQRGTSVGGDFDRHLVVGATHTAGLDLEQRLTVLYRFLEEFQSVVAAALLFEGLHRLIEDALGCRLLSAPHHRVHKLGHQRGPVDWIRRHFPLRNVPFSRHSSQNPSRIRAASAALVRVPNSAPEPLVTSCPSVPRRPWRAWPRTLNDSACGWPRPPNPECPGPRDNAHPADPLHGLRG